MFSSSIHNTFFYEEKSQENLSSNFLMLFSRLEAAKQINTRQVYTPVRQDKSQFQSTKYTSKRSASIHENNQLNLISPFSEQRLSCSTSQHNVSSYIEHAKGFNIHNDKLAATGNIFSKRQDWSIINKLPIEKQNTIHIRLEDEGPYGNDEIRYFVLSHLSKLGIKELNCVFCNCLMPVYDRFPLVDGTLFASPYSYDTHNQIPVFVSEKRQFIYGICLKCLNGSDPKHEIKCKHCNDSWQKFGKQIQIGTFYKYDLFAANPCCQMRVNCNKCHKQLLDLKTGALPYFSLYSEKTKCPHCFSEDYHFIKQLNKIFLEKNL